MEPAAPGGRVVGRYALHDEIAAGGMATVHLGRLVGPVGFSRTVAIKRLHPQFAKDPEFVGMFLDEARLAARIQHPHVVTTLDVVPLEDEVFLVMEYVHGESLSRLVRASRRRARLPPVKVVAAIVAGALHGLHAAHEAKSERGEPLGIVHRDISPQNVLVGTDGVGRVLDFGVAKAALRAQTTREGQMKGKVSYMAPEQLLGLPVDRRSDIFAMGVVLWEALTAERLFDGVDTGEVMSKLLDGPIVAPSVRAPSVPGALDAVALRALERDPERRFQTAREFAIALENAGPMALPREVGEWVDDFAGEALAVRAAALTKVERGAAAMPAVALTSSPSHVPILVEADQTLRTQAETLLSAVSSAGTAPAPRRRKALLIAVAAAMLSAVLLLTFLAGTRRAATRDAAPLAVEPRDSLHASTPPAPATTATAAQPAPAPSAEPAEPLMPSAVASAAASAVTAPTAHGARPTSVPASTAHPHPVSSPAKPSCNPPYSIDAKGIKRIKPGCL